MKLVGAGVAGGVLALAGFNLAGAATGSSDVPGFQQYQQRGADSGPGGPGGPGHGETPLTGDAADQVTAVAQSAACPTAR